MMQDNDSLKKALLVGVTHVAKSGFLSGLNNLAVYPFMAPMFTTTSLALLRKRLNVLLDTMEPLMQ